MPAQPVAQAPVAPAPEPAPAPVPEDDGDKYFDDILSMLNNRGNN